MHRGVEGTEDERKAFPEMQAAHVTSATADALAYWRGLCCEAFSQVPKHGGRVVHAYDGQPVTCEWQGDASVSDAVLENRAANALGKADVELHVVDSSSICRGVVVGVVVVRARSHLELAIQSTPLRR
jgi:hypothetical protein